MSYTAILFLATLGLPDEAARDSRTESNSPRSMRSIEREITDAMRREAMAKTSSAREVALRQLVQLYQDLSRDSRASTSRTIQQFGMRIRTRLRRLERELVRGLGREKASSLSDSKRSSNVAGAQGGRAQFARDHGQALVELIQATIAPDSWDVNGGNNTIYYFAPRHALVVRAPGEVHSRTRRLLNDLR